MKRRLLVVVLLALLLGAGGAVVFGLGRYSARAADMSRRLIGDEKTAQLESWFFAGQDRVDRLRFRISGDLTQPFGPEAPKNEVASVSTSAQLPASADETAVGAAGLPVDDPPPSAPAVPPSPSPLALPSITPLYSLTARGEAVWSTDGLPHSSPDDVLMAKTLIRPDPQRPYATVGVLLVDKRRVDLHMVGGREDPGGDVGVHGPGVLPDADRENLLVAWNGGFKGAHGSWGMYADGQTYRPLRNGFASVAVSRDGSVRIGTWGKDFGWSDDLVAVRQNAVLLVDNCEVSPRTNEGNDTWGFVEVNSADFITWRSAIGLTANGDLMIAAGNSLSASTLARAMAAAGACEAMQLDINSPYVLTSLFFQQDDGTIRAAKFMDTMPDNPRRFLTTQPRDFMYLTLDESRYK